MVFGWRADDGPTLNAGFVALWFFRGSGPVLLRNPIFCDFSGGWGGGGVDPDNLSTLWIWAWATSVWNFRTYTVCIFSKPISHSYLSRYHHQKWLHQDIKARFSRKNASVQNINNTSLRPLDDMPLSICFRPLTNNRSEPPQAKNKHKNVNNSTPVILAAFSFVKSSVIMWATDSIISITVRNVCKAVNKLLLVYFLGVFVAYFLNTAHWIQPHITIKSNSSPDVTVLRKHWLIPSPYQILVKSEPLSQYSILFFAHFLCLPEKQTLMYLCGLWHERYCECLWYPNLPKLNASESWIFFFSFIFLPFLGLILASVVCCLIC